MWLSVAVFYALRWRATRIPRMPGEWAPHSVSRFSPRPPTYLFAPWILAAILLRPLLSQPREAARALTAALVIAFAINAPFFARNLDLSGSPFGFDSAQADGVYRWRNESFGLKQTASNVLRNAADQVGTRSAIWNQAVYDAVLSAHRALGMSPKIPPPRGREPPSHRRAMTTMKPMRPTPGMS